MLTSKSILVGALVLGAASVPAGLVVTDFGLTTVPPAPAAIVVEAPDLSGPTLRLTEPFRPVVLVPPAPRAVSDVLEPDAAVEDFSEVALVRPELSRPDGPPGT
jgi:hypothetical protein